MKRKLAVIYDTANVIGCISRCEVEVKHLFSPLLLPLGVDVAVAVVPVIRKDLAQLSRWGEILEGAFSIVENKIKSFDLYKREEEFSHYIHEVKLALEAIEVLDDASEVARLAPSPFYRPYVVKDLDPKISQDEEIERELINLAKGLRECKDANLREAVEDVQMYFLPYVNLLEKGFALALVTSDECFGGLVGAHSAQKRLEVEVVEVALLANVRKLIRRLARHSSQ